MGFEIIGEGDHMHVVEFEYEPGRDGPPAHIHVHHSDAFRVLEGELELTLGPEREPVRLPPGGFALAPPGLVHTFRNPGPGAARFLNFHAPGMGFAALLRGENNAFDQQSPPGDGGRPLADALIVPPGAGDAVALGPNETRFVAEGVDHLSLTETTVVPGFPGPVPHTHAGLTDSFYVLEGALDVRRGEETLTLSAGDYAYVPPGVAHTFWNAGEAPVRFLNVMAPGGFEQYLREEAALLDPPDPQGDGGDRGALRLRAGRLSRHLRRSPSGRQAHGTRNRSTERWVRVSVAASATYPIGFVVATAGAFVLVARRLAPARAAFSLAALWATAFAVAFALATLGWNDADGFVDCNDFCSTTQTAVGFTLFLSPPLVFGLLVLGMVLHARGRRRAR